MPLSFGLVDATISIGSHIPPPWRDGDSTLKDLMQALTNKILHMPIFSSLELMAPYFEPTRVFHLVGRLLEDNVDLSCLQVFQAITHVSLVEDPKELLTLRPKLAT